MTERSTLSRVEFFVSGLPRPQGSKRIVQPRGHTKPLMIESSKGLSAWRQDVAYAARMASRKFFWKAPPEASMRVLFLLPRPPSHINGKGLLRKGAPLTPRGKPDLDKLARAVFDAVRGILVTDDASIVSLVAHKRYSREGPGCFVIVESAEPQGLDGGRDLVERSPVRLELLPVFSEGGDL